MGKNESSQHRLIKKLLEHKLREWFKTSAVPEYASSGHELDVYLVTYQGLKIQVEIIWTPSPTQFYKDINIMQASDANVKISIVNPKIIQNEGLLRHYEKIVVGEAAKGFILSEMIDGQRILDDKNYLDLEVKKIIFLLISQTSKIRDKFHNELNQLGLMGKLRLVTKDENMGKPDVNCWKRGTFELADIKQCYDARRTIIDEIVNSIEKTLEH